MEEAKGLQEEAQRKGTLRYHASADVELLLASLAATAAPSERLLGFTLRQMLSDGASAVVEDAVHPARGRRPIPIYLPGPPEGLGLACAKLRVSRVQPAGSFDAPPASPPPHGALLAPPLPPPGHPKLAGCATPCCFSAGQRIQSALHAPLEDGAPSASPGRLKAQGAYAPQRGA